MPLPVFYSRVEEARKDREICLCSQKEQQTELVLQVVLLPGSFLMEQGFAAVTETRRRDGCPSDTAYTEARGACAPVLGL